MVTTTALIVGAGGQLGQALVQHAPSSISVHALTRAELDIGNTAAVHAVVHSCKPNIIINAAAYTAVDKAEAEVEAARLGNVTGPANLAAAAKACGARMIHVSTDFVFDGRQSTPYQVDDAVVPLGVYGQTKRDGELAVLAELGADATVVRTAWVYAAQGKNFVNTMLRLMRERGAVRVVADQVGTPTCTHSLADVLWQCAQRNDISGVLHWTDAGVASWYDFAVAIAEEAVASGLLPAFPEVTPIETHDYPTPAKRPAYSVLDKSATYAALGLKPIHWRTRLREVIAQKSK